MNLSPLQAMLRAQTATPSTAEAGYRAAPAASGPLSLYAPGSAYDTYKWLQVPESDIGSLYWGNALQAAGFNDPTQVVTGQETGLGESGMVTRDIMGTNPALLDWLKKNNYTVATSYGEPEIDGRGKGFAYNGIFDASGKPVGVQSYGYNNTHDWMDTAVPALLAAMGGYAAYGALGAGAGAGGAEALTGVDAAMADAAASGSLTGSSFGGAGAASAGSDALLSGADAAELGAGGSDAGYAGYNTGALDMPAEAGSIPVGTSEPGWLDTLQNWGGKLWNGDPKTQNQLRMIMGGLGLASSLFGNKNKGPSAADLAAQTRSPYSSWTPAQQANADAYFNRPHPFEYKPLNLARGGPVHGQGCGCAMCSGGPVELAHGGALHGPDPGQADTVHARLSPGEYVIDADVVSALGDGNNDAGAQALDEMREQVRRHKRAAPAHKIPPKAKSPLEYLSKKGR